MSSPTKTEDTNEGSPTERTGLMAESANTASPKRNYTATDSNTDDPSRFEVEFIQDSNQSANVDPEGTTAEPSTNTATAPPPTNTGNANAGRRRRGRRQRQPTVEEEEEELMYGAKHVILLFIPITICMSLVVATISSLSFYTKKGVYLYYTPFHEDTKDPTKKFLESAANALILLVVIILVTVLLFLLYKYKCYKLIGGWLFLSSVVLLFAFSFLYIEQVLKANNAALDYFTVSIIMWNFGITGMLNVHWKGPLLVQQAYLITISCLVALMFIKYMPSWTTWAILAVLVVWDLVAVLCPLGPLRMLVETAQERDEQIFPALIYSSTMMWPVITMADVDRGTNQNTSENASEDASQNTSENASQNTSQNKSGTTTPTEHKEANGELTQSNTEEARRAVRAIGDMTPSENDTTRSRMEIQPENQNRPVRPQNRPARRVRREVEVEQEEDQGVKLGLGDFIFFSVLVGKASSYGDWNTTIACFLAVLIGLACTLILLAIWKKALPALPISLTFGLIFNFATSVLVRPFLDKLASEQVYI